MDMCQIVRGFCQHQNTPFYIYQEQDIKNKTDDIKNIFNDQTYEFLYAMKANSNPQIIKSIVSSGFGIDACSIEEVRIATLCGVPPGIIYYNADCLTIDEIDTAFKSNVNIVIGSLDALRIIVNHFPDTCISLRVNTGVGSGHSSKVITNGELSKFGILLTEIEEAGQLCAAASVLIKGIHSHTGSGDMNVGKYLENAAVLAELAKRFTSLEFINFGGGFGYDYTEHKAYDLSKIHTALQGIRKGLDLPKHLKFFIEPGRYIVAGSGMLISRVCSVKHTPSRNFIGLDTGYNHFPRCFYYDAWHDIQNISNNNTESNVYDVTGYLCQSGDVFARQRVLSRTEVGDLICIKDVGAYGYAMSSNFNSRVRPAEFLLKRNGEIKLIRRSENIDDIISTCILD